MVYWNDLFRHLPPYSFIFFFNILIVKFLLTMPNLQILLVKTGRLDHEKPFSTVTSHCHIWIPKCGVLHGIPPPPTPSPPLPCLKYTNTLHRNDTCFLVHHLKYIQETHRGTPLPSGGTDVLCTRQYHGWNSNPEFYMKPYLLNWPAYNKITTLSLPNWR